MQNIKFIECLELFQQVPYIESVSAKINSGIVSELNFTVGQHCKFKLLAKLIVGKLYLIITTVRLYCNAQTYSMYRLVSTQTPSFAFPCGNNPFSYASTTLIRIFTWLPRQHESVSVEIYNTRLFTTSFACLAPFVHLFARVKVSHITETAKVVVSLFVYCLPLYCFRLELWLPTPSSESPRTLVMIRIFFRSSLDFFFFPLARMLFKLVVDGVGDLRFLPTDVVDERRLPGPAPPLRRFSSFTLNFTENIVAHLQRPASSTLLIRGSLVVQWRKFNYENKHPIN